LNEYIKELGQLRDRVAARDNSLLDTFAQAQQLRLQWQASYNIE